MVTLTLGPDEFLEYATSYIECSAYNAISTRDTFHIVLAGGKTPRHLYAKLINIKTLWEAWHVWFSDERCLMKDDQNLNSCMVDKTLLRHVPIRSSNIHRISGELGADEAARQYQNDIKHIPEFDLTLLGLGLDGHTASLFPEHDLGLDANAPDVLAIYNAPKPPTERVSLSAKRLNYSREVLFLATGESKHPAIKKYQDGSDIPANKITGSTRTTMLYCP